MLTKSLVIIFVGFVTLIGANLAHAQHRFYRTRTVDLKTVGDPPQPVADYKDIREAIDSVPEDPSDKWTILVYAGTYTIDSVAKLIELDENKENVDIVGIDREAVIINVTIGDAQNPRSGIKITSGGETSRNNRIANLTIKTTYGHGIEIVKGGTPVPKNITIEGVTIEAAGTDKDGMYTAETQALRIANCKITTTNGHGIEFINTSESREPSHNILLHDLTIRAGGDGKYAIRAKGAEGVPAKQHLRVADLLLYDESALSLSKPDTAARRP